MMVSANFSSVFFHLAIAILSGSTGQELSSNSSALLAEIRQVFLANQLGSQRGRTQPPNNGAAVGAGRCRTRDRMGHFKRSISQFTRYVHYVSNNWTKYMRYIYEKSILQWWFAPTKRDFGASKVPSGNDSHGLQGGWSRYISVISRACLPVFSGWSSEMWPPFLFLPCFNSSMWKKGYWWLLYLFSWIAWFFIHDSFLRIRLK